MNSHSLPIIEITDSLLEDTSIRKYNDFTPQGIENNQDQQQNISKKRKNFNEIDSKFESNKQRRLNNPPSNIDNQLQLKTIFSNIQITIRALNALKENIEKKIPFNLEDLRALENYCSQWSNPRYNFNVEVYNREESRLRCGRIFQIQKILEQYKNNIPVGLTNCCILDVEIDLLTSKINESNKKINNINNSEQKSTILRTSFMDLLNRPQITQNENFPYKDDVSLNLTNLLNSEINNQTTRSSTNNQQTNNGLFEKNKKLKDKNKKLKDKNKKLKDKNKELEQKNQTLMIESDKMKTTIQNLTSIVTNRSNYFFQNNNPNNFNLHSINDNLTNNINSISPNITNTKGGE